MDAARPEQAPRAHPAARPGRPLRPLRVMLGAALGVLALTGCTFTNPQTTTASYVPGDGQDVSLGSVVVSSLMVVTEDEGEPGRLVARVVNGGSEPERVTFTGEGVDEVVSAPPQSTVAVGDPDDEDAVDVLIDAVSAAPGRLVLMTLALEGGEVVEIGVPVLDGTLEQYAPYLPTPEESTTGPRSDGDAATADPGSTGPAATPSPTPEPSATPTSSSS